MTDRAVNTPDCDACADAPPEQTADAAALIAVLRTAGAQGFDPVRLHHAETLARRAVAHQGSVRHALDARLAQALADLQARFTLAQDNAAQALSRGTQQHPQAAEALQRHFDAGEFSELQRLLANLDARERIAALRSLTRRLDQHSAENTTTDPSGHAGAQPELKVIRQFRNTWAKLSVDKQVAQTLAQAPKNAGPINSHMLALRSLALMRDISPDYLNRFISYADTLLRLDPGEPEKPSTPKKQQAAKKK